MYPARPIYRTTRTGTPLPAPASQGGRRAGGAGRAGPTRSWLARRRSARRGTGDPSHGLDRVRLFGLLVVPVAHQAREAQRETGRVVRARLQAVERDFHHDRGADVPDRPLPAD